MVVEEVLEMGKTVRDLGVRTGAEQDKLATVFEAVRNRLAD
jgi:hypothetical protein